MKFDKNKLYGDILQSLLKLYDVVNKGDSEFDSRYKLADILIKKLWDYRDEDFKIEEKRKDVVIFNRENNPIIIIETKALGKSNKKDVFKQLKGYVKSTSTKYLIGTNIESFWFWEFNPLTKDYREISNLNIKKIKEELDKKTEIEDIFVGKKLQKILYLRKLSKQNIWDDTILDDFSSLYHKVNVFDENGFNELIEQLSRIIYDVFLEYTLRIFEKNKKKFEEYQRKKTEFLEIKKNSSEKLKLSQIERSLSQLKHDYAKYRDFGFNAWLLYSNRSISKFEENKTIFCKESIYILINKILFIRILEDKHLIKPHISNGGIETLREFIHQKNERYKSIMDFAIKNAKTLYSHFYDPGILDWLISGNGELDYLLNRTLWILNSFDFSSVDDDILGRMYEKYLPVEERKQLGEFYTPPLIVEYILDKVGYKKSFIRGKKILDPACGSGGFLIGVVKRLKTEYLNFYGKNKLNELEPYEAQRIIDDITDHVFGWDVNPFACHISEMNILFQIIDLIKISMQDGDFKLKRLNIFQTDSLIKKKIIMEKIEHSGSLYKSMDIWLKENSERMNIYEKEQKYINKLKNLSFNFIVGNPPYLALKYIPSDMLDIYKKNFPVVSKGRTDLYILFLKLGIELLKEKGKLGFIVSDQFLTKSVGESIKNVILNETKLIELTDFQKFLQFLDATNYTCVIILEKCDQIKERKKNPIQYNYILKEDENLIDFLGKNKKKPEIIRSILLKQKNLQSKQFWKFESAKGNLVLEKIENTDFKLNDFALDIKNKKKCTKVGLNTNLDDIYIGTFEIDEKDPEIANFTPLIEIKDKTYKFYQIEKDMIQNIIFGRNVKRYDRIKSNKGVIFPHKKKKAEAIDSCNEYIYEPISEKEMSRDFPKTLKYLQDHETAIKNRTYSKGVKYGDLDIWYKLHRTRKVEIYEKNLILTRGINNFPNFCFNQGGFKFVGGGGGVFALMLDDVILKKNKITPKYILGVLNSSAYSFYARNKGSVKRGGHYQISGYIYDDFPIKIPSKEKNEKINEIQDLVSKRIEIESKLTGSNNIMVLWENYDMINISNSNLINEIKIPEIAEGNDILFERDDDRILINKKGHIKCKNTVVSESINLFLKYSDISESLTLKEDILNMKVIENESDYEDFLTQSSVLVNKMNNISNSKKDIEKKIDNIVYEIYNLDSDDIEFIESKIVRPSF